MTTDPRGEIVEIANRGSFIVAGVFQDVPGNSHLQFNFIASILGDERYQENLDQWSNSSYLTYIRLHDEKSVALAGEHIQALVAKYDTGHESGEKEFRLQPVKSIHLRSHINFEISPNGDIRFVYLLFGIGIVILALACVNYVNLAVTRSVQRAREIGVRKVVGAMRAQIAVQFLSESILTAVISVGLALLIVIISFPTFVRFIGQDLSVLAGGVLSFSLMMVAFILIVGILGGLYPSLVASRMRPAIILKGSGRHSPSSGRLRIVLVTLQFCVSVSLLAASVIMFRQMQFIQDTDIGYARDQIVTIQLADPTLRSQISSIRTSLMENSGVISVAGSGHLPINIQSSTGISKWTDGKADGGVTVYQNSIDYDFLDLYGIPIIEGRGFSEDHPSDTLGAYVFNETAFRRFGWQDLDGKYIYRSGRDREVVGVMRDFHMHSLYMNIEPLMFYLQPDNESKISIKLASANMRETLAFVQSEMQRLSAYPITVKFVDESFDELYESDLQLARTVGLFMGLALLIGALGLFGLVAYSAETRTKEIGIRKVMGSSVSGVLILFARDYASLIVVASAIGLPLAYFVMNSWLEHFAYRITLNPLDFVLAVMLLAIVAAVSISYQTIRAALTDPVQALRYE